MLSSAPSAPEVPPRGLSRRQLLALSATAALTPWLGRAAEAALPPQPESSLSVGYLEGSDALPSLRALPWSLDEDAKASFFPVLPAAELPLGDSNLLYRAVNLRLHGLYPARARSCPEIDAAALEVLFPSIDPLAPGLQTFFAWVFKRKPGWNAGQTMTFPVPVEGDGKLRLVLLVRRVGDPKAGTPPVVERFETAFTVGREPGLPKLQRGIYLLGLNRGSWDSPKALAGPRVKGLANPCSLAVSLEGAPED